MSKEIIIYETIRGKKPYQKWFDKLQKKDATTAARIVQRLQILQSKGHYGDYKHLKNGVYELRYTFAGGYRVYFAEDGNTIIILLIGGNKGSQQQDIQKAMEYWQDYQSR